MVESPGERPAAASLLPDLRLHRVREPAVLVLLAAITVVCFAAVSGLSRSFHAQQRSLGTHWFNRGVTDLNNRRYERAVAEFRSAMQYSPENYSYQFNLAEALIGLKRFDEASAYLTNLWERQPEDGLVNLELARIAVHQGQQDRALRYYHNAIYATWPNGRESARRQTRLELIDHLLKNGLRADARSEIIALQANLGNDPPMQARVGSLFMRARYYADALAAFQASLKSVSGNAAAWAGAGRAALQLGNYRLAQRYLEAARRAGRDDPEDASQLEIAGLALSLDPFQARLPDAERHRIVLNAFKAAGLRLETCAAAAGGMPPGLEPLNSAWTQMKPKLTARNLARDSSLAQTVMDQVFEIEAKAESCGQPRAADRALLLIARFHEGN